MREIKFRAWDKANKKILDIEDLHWDDCTREFLIRTTMYRDYFDTEDMILMQYAGLRDKNGKEIYEGDIVEVTRQCIFEKGVVVFIDGCYFVKVKEVVLALYECEPNNYKLKVIGNIYENPELLERSINGD